MGSEQLKGTGVALVTPFNEDLSVDYPGLKKTLDYVSNGGVDYLVVLGTTGESPTLSSEEKIEILEFVFANNPNNLPVVYGYGGNHTEGLIKGLSHIQDYPITALLSASPYYNKPSQKGIYEHYKQLATNSPFPVLLYNVPGRTASNISAETTIALSQIKQIIGTKEAAGDLIQCAKIKKGVNADFLLISGDDALTLPIIALGGAGVISVVANLEPEKFTNLVSYALNNNYPDAQALNLSLLEGYELAGLEGNPVSIKSGMEAAQIIKRHVRLPLFPGSDELVTAYKKYLS